MVTIAPVSLLSRISTTPVVKSTNAKTSTNAYMMMNYANPVSVKMRWEHSNATVSQDMTGNPDKPNARILTNAN